MAENPAFYRDRAREQRDAAEATTLANVRNRCLSAAESWERMAERGEGIGRRQAERLVAATPAE
ncbi:hypothetical protein FHT02_002865 [Sphingomonas xinjiangensis]|uniref:Uncharacterized protein n=1 Tax=Sphingomonas xinjiangensis TaxID=643568 RepID=A0A840YHV8_9SPHN|nr:hypothetical protein [Sphingomonas xinjiangensis]